MNRRTVRRPRRGEAGFSLTEVVIASVMLMTMAISVLPVFTKATASNETGREYTEISNLARSRAEELMQLPFNASQLTITSGTQLVAEEQYSSLNRRWISGGTTLSAGDRALYLRRTTIRQYGITNVETLDQPLAAGTPAEGIHVKEILVEVRGMAGSSVFGPSKSLSVRMLKSL